MTSLHQIPYYFETGPYPTVASRIFGGGATQAAHLTLEGAIQNFLDGVHLILRSQQAIQAFGGELDGAWAEQAQLSDALTQVDALAKFWPRFYLDSVPQGTTADAIGLKYKTEATALFAAYGQS